MTSTATPQTEAELVSFLSIAVKEAEAHSEVYTQDRYLAASYYAGRMPDLPAQENRTGVVSNELRAQLRAILPSLRRTFFGGSKFMRVEAHNPELAQLAKDATDHINRVVLSGSKLETAVMTSLFEACINGLGILSWDAVASTETKERRFDRIHPEAMPSLPADAQITNKEENEDGTFSFVATWKETQNKLRVRAVPIGGFLIDPSAINMEEASIVGEKVVVTRSDLVGMGVNRDVAETLSAYERSYTGDTAGANEEGREAGYQSIQSLGGFLTGDAYQDTTTTRETDNILVYRVFVRLDRDGDGIAEMHEITMAEGGGALEGSGAEYIILSDELHHGPLPFAPVRVEEAPFSFVGRSITHDVYPYQRIATNLLRAGVNNTLAASQVQMAYVADRLVDVNDATNTEFGRPIELAGGNGKIEDAIRYTHHPFVAPQIQGMTDALRKEIVRTTGIDEGGGALPPEMLSNTAATTAAIFNESALNNIQFRVATAATGIKMMLEGVWRMYVQHYAPEVVAEQDPEEFAVSLEIGLGTGSRNAEVAMWGQVLAQQEKIVASAGVDNPFAGPKEINNAMVALVEAIGVTNSESYIKQPSEEDIIAFVQKQTAPPDTGESAEQTAEMAQNAEAAKQEALERTQQGQAIAAQHLEKLKQEGAERLVRIKQEGTLASEAQMKQLELGHAEHIATEKLAYQQSLAEITAETSRQKENNQRDAAVQEAVAKAQISGQLERDKLAFEKYKFDAQQQLEREKLALEAIPAPLPVPEGIL